MIPGASQIKLINDQWYCQYHNRMVEPMWVGSGNDAHTPACPHCLINDIGGVQEFKEAEAKAPEKTKFDCHIGGCNNLAQGFCLMCKERFCLHHIDHDKVLCTDCMGLGGMELGKDEDEEDEEFDLLDTDTSGTYFNRRRLQ